MKSVTCTKHPSFTTTENSISNGSFAFQPSVPEGVLDLSTRSEYGTVPIKESEGPFIASDVKQKTKESFGYSNFSFINPGSLSPTDIFQSVVSWIPSYNLLLATREYMNILLRKSTTNIPTTGIHDESTDLMSQECNAWKNLTRLYTSHSYGEQSDKPAVTDDSNYRTVKDNHFLVSPNMPTSILSNPSALSSSSLTSEPVLNSLFNNGLPSRYSPPLNFSAFASVDQNMICPICCKCFRFEKNLLRHLQKTHSTGTGESVLKCKLCNYTTRHYSNMYVHIRTHTGDKPYSCAACGVSFTQGSSLKLHIRSRHGDNAKYFSLTHHSKSLQENTVIKVRPEPSVANSAWQSLAFDAVIDSDLAYSCNRSPNLTLSDIPDNTHLSLERKTPMKCPKKDHTESTSTLEYECKTNHLRVNFFDADGQHYSCLPKMRQSLSPSNGSCVPVASNCKEYPVRSDPSTLGTRTDQIEHECLEIRSFHSTLPSFPKPEYLFTTSRGENGQNLRNSKCERQSINFTHLSSDYSKLVEHY
ncbi:Zinc finger protein [Fasciola gigantica]|uniref:Zinc finger protein n=1 Tax=Fasciola gigantica TaxID=46835 RepID=A0A504YTE8_FASGI|nr:Zinc finger protein [Fasciola gigantica]